jgi:putative ABC transport system permease protein
MLAGRRAGQVPPVAALSASAGVDTTGKALTRAKVVTGGLITLLGLGTGMSTLAQENGPLLSSTAGPAGVAVAVGLALLAPAAATAGGGGLARSRSVVMRLAGRTLKTRARQQGSLIAPLTLLIGVGSGTLAMQRIEDSQPATDGPHLATVNYLIVLAIVGFAVVAASNTLVAATRARGHDFKLLALTGATRRQILAVVGTEALITTVIAAILGGVATAVTVLPFSVVRTGTLIPAQAGPLFVLLVAVALAITILASVPTAVRQIRATATQ